MIEIFSMGTIPIYTYFVSQLRMCSIDEQKMIQENETKVCKYSIYRMFDLIVFPQSWILISS